MTICKMWYVRLEGKMYDETAMVGWICCSVCGTIKSLEKERKKALYTNLNTCISYEGFA